MSQFGMQMPAGQRKRGASVDIYTALMALAVVALSAACFAMFKAGQKVAVPGATGAAGSPFALQTPGKIVLPKPEGK
ncbi:MAG TPA: hypothetical protein VFB82_20460 [Blastocatellia bacterium]|nr:hypothetical protein [Blastocatellia bacterium]